MRRATYAGSVWEAMFREGYRYEAGFMVKDTRYVPVPKGERRIAAAAGRIIWTIGRHDPGTFIVYANLDAAGDSDAAWAVGFNAQGEQVLELIGEEAGAPWATLPKAPPPSVVARAARLARRDLEREARLEAAAARRDYQREAGA